MEHLVTWKYENYKLALCWKGNPQNIEYRLLQNGNTIFVGDGYKPSPCHSVDGLDSVMGLLSFLSLKSGDTDWEYFDKYTKDQLAWVDGNAEDLRLILYDYENYQDSLRSVENSDSTLVEYFITPYGYEEYAIGTLNWDED